MKILLPVLTRHLRHGGVTQFVINFVKYAPRNIEVHDLESVVSSNLKVTVQGLLSRIMRKIIYAIRFLLFDFRLKNADHVLLNPSLSKKAIKRDIFYANRCIHHNIPFTLFIHGWDWSFSSYLDDNPNSLNEFIDVLKLSSSVYVLSSKFKEKLISWGVPEHLIYLEFTTVNDDFIPDEPVIKKAGNSKKILFLARVVKEKGIFEALDAFKIHLSSSPNSVFIIAGVGPDLEEAKDYVRNFHISNVQFLGFVEGEEKKKLLLDSDIFLLPSYSEGMPICIFEAMAYGNFIITRPVGGIADYFTSEMGILVESLDPNEFAEALNSAVLDSSYLEKAALFNHEFVSRNCKSSVSTQRLISRME